MKRFYALLFWLLLLGELGGCTYNITIDGNSDTVTMTNSVPIMATVPVSAIP